MDWTFMIIIGLIVLLVLILLIWMLINRARGRDEIEGIFIPRRKEKEDK
jgi:hypothetical protein